MQLASQPTAKFQVGDIVRFKIAKAPPFLTPRALFKIEKIDYGRFSGSTLIHLDENDVRFPMDNIAIGCDYWYSEDRFDLISRGVELDKLPHFLKPPQSLSRRELINLISTGMELAYNASNLHKLYLFEEEATELLNNYLNEKNK